jgi:hypothetical protein
MAESDRLKVAFKREVTLEQASQIPSDVYKGKVQFPLGYISVIVDANADVSVLNTPSYIAAIRG